MAYVGGTIKAVKSFTDGSKTISILFSQVGTNTALLTNTTWQYNVLQGLLALKSFSDSIRRLDPPFYFSDIHSDFLEAADHVDNAVDQIAGGLDNLDSDKLNTGLIEYKAASTPILSSETV